MKITLYQIDSFTDKIFGGNPAGVIITDEWLKDELMQNIAYENNLSETSFIVKTIYDTQQEIESIKPNFHKLSLIDARGIIVSSIGDDVDFVSRFFAPSVGINEDPVTGSAHTTLTPYWSTQLDKTKLIAKQISKREGDLICENLNDRVSISGKAILYMTAEIYV
ncbi:UNVERIFIED_CONTAM: hypothetical protein GTU68_002066 [Idotea baltica]|nr:hypothetical protein [Idotea baltica]